MNRGGKQPGENHESSPMRMTRREFLAQNAALVATLSGSSAFAPPLLFGSNQDVQTASGSVRAQIQDRQISLENEMVGARWDVSRGGLRFLSIRDQRTGNLIDSNNAAFAVMMAGRSSIASSAMHLVETPMIEDLRSDAQASRFSERVPGRAIVASFEDSHHRLRATWRAILRDGSHYIRQEVKFESLKKQLPISAVTMLDLEASGAAVIGTVKGSPVTRDNWFFALEHPLSDSSVNDGHARCTFARQLPLQHGRPAVYSSVIGSAAPGQMRRDFLRYVERERAHPYRTFLHYNSWFDLGYFTPYDEKAAVDVIRAFGEELRDKRNVALDSFLFDDGWDNHKSFWEFNSGFPNGFTPVRAAAEQCHAEPGIWLSPWGGYDGPRKERLAYGKEHGIEENAEGFVLSGPKYYKRFHEVCLEMIQKYGVNHFKFDGTGDASKVYPGSEFDSDFAAMISLIGDLRAAEPNLYVNLTTSTYPSPFWLRYADSIWRGGDDTEFAGVGTNRQRWITYRDADTHQNVVKRGPLYPLNSLMLHGMVYGRDAEKLNDDPGGDFSSEIRSYFGTGTQLQEMYVTHSLLSDSNWDDLAEAAQWSRRNADLLVDSHWIGGDPAKLEVYGWASWSSRGGIVTLRNPNQVGQAFDLDVHSAFELPVGAAENYAARSPWRRDAGHDEIILHAGKPCSFTLQPFEVLTLEAVPR